ncbi:MAG: phosphoribosyltransferase [Phycisphaerales bacterium]|jgi:putative phosphoribosyl transferase
MTTAAFQDRADAGRQLAERLRSMPLTDPLVLAMPRGGIDVAWPIAQALHAELDVVLARKLRSPSQPELALGAIREDGEVQLEPHARHPTEVLKAHIEAEKKVQRAEIDRAKALYRTVRPQATMTGRSVVVVDDGIATGSTMIAAMECVRAQNPCEIVMATPVAPRDRMPELRRHCDRAVVLVEASDFATVGSFFGSFAQVSDDHVVEVLREHGHQPGETGVDRARLRAAGSGAPARLRSPDGRGR